MLVEPEKEWKAAKEERCGHALSAVSDQSNGLESVAARSDAVGRIAVEVEPRGWAESAKAILTPAKLRG